MKGFVKGSYTIEAAVYIPLILLLLCFSLKTGIGFLQESRNREGNRKLMEIDSVKEFYMYQILGEIGKELSDD